MSTCCICLSDGANFHKLQCKCKVLMHNQCAIELKTKLNMLCPFCRKRSSEMVAELTNEPRSEGGDALCFIIFSCFLIPLLPLLCVILTIGFFCIGFLSTCDLLFEFLFMKRNSREIFISQINELYN